VKITLQLQLLPDPEQATHLKAMMMRFNEAADWLAGEACTLKTANKVKLQQLYYRELRDRFGLSAQMAVRCIAQACECYKRDKTQRPHIRQLAAIPYDQRTMSFKGLDKVSLLTMQGRVIVPFLMGTYQRERFTAAVGQSDLVLRKDGKWFLLVTVEAPESVQLPTSDFIGVDFGPTNLLTTSDGEQASGEDVEQCRQRYQTRRRNLQKAASAKQKKGKRPKNIRRVLKRTHQKEARFRKDLNHRLSKQLIGQARDTARGIALEDLTGIRGRTRFRKGQRAKMSGWAFFQLRTFIEYKAHLAGIPVVLVDPAYTSQECQRCGHRSRKNRPDQARFQCQLC
jgi:IS605 OrfB family transposase